MLRLLSRHLKSELVLKLTSQTLLSFIFYNLLSTKEQHVIKKTTLVLALLSFGAQAQEFPFPYCEIIDSNDVSVEEITSVDFAGITISNSDTDSVLIDETATILGVFLDDPYTIEIEGNTYGNFDTDIVVFIGIRMMS